jgi:hypothetical protein
LKFRLLDTVYTKHDKRLFPWEGKIKEREREKFSENQQRKRKEE